MRSSLSELALRWIGRLWAAASLLLLSRFVFGGAEPHPWPTTIDWIGLACFPIGVSAGLALGFWNERLGGGVAVGSLAGFYTWRLAVAGVLSAGPWFFIITVPGFLFLAADWLRRRRTVRHAI